MDIQKYNELIISVSLFRELENKISDFSGQIKGHIFELLTKYIFET
jgi:hypothetical protein